MENEIETENLESQNNPLGNVINAFENDSNVIFADGLPAPMIGSS